MIKHLKKRGKTWYGVFALNSGDKPEVKSLRTTDKEVAQKKLNEIASQIEREAAGIAIPAKIKQAAQLPLGKHLDRYLGEKSREWTSEKHYQLSTDRLNRLVKDCEWKRIRDIDASSFLQWRSQQNSKGNKTLNDFLSCAKGFTKWLVQNGLIEIEPLATVRPLKKKGQAFERKALKPEEITALLESVKDPMRRAVYITALYTGLRRAEIEGVEYGDLHLDVEVPYLYARAVTTKNGKDATIPLHPVVLEALETIKQKNPSPADKVFLVPSLKWFKSDLKRAGIAYKDERGNKTDFHALRGTYCTMMQVAGVAPRVAQSLMRHSDIKLTMKNYTDANLLPTAQAVAGLPDYTSNLYRQAVPSDSTNRDASSPNESEKREGSELRKPLNSRAFRPCKSCGVPPGKMAEREGFEPSLLLSE